MIGRIAHSFGLSLGLAAAILAVQVALAHGDAAMMVKAVILLGFGLLLNVLCRRFKIIGKRSHLTLVVFSMLAGLLFPVFDLTAMVTGVMWLVAVSLAFSSWEDQSHGQVYLIYIGILLGISQVLYPHAVYLFIPFFILFYQNAVLDLRHYLLSIFYFILVLLAALALAVAMGIGDRIASLFPTVRLDFSELLHPQFQIMLPVLLLILLLHMAFIGTYRFRYPNRSININRLFFYQLLLGILFVMLSSSAGALVLFILPAAILLSVTFTFTQGRPHSEALFAALTTAVLGLSYFFL